MAKPIKKKIVPVFIAVFVLFLTAELLARFVLGLGTPPLYISDPKIEYMLKPNQHVKRFGNTFITNSYGMRSREFPKKKRSKKEIRILLIGDSILNGGSQNDHDSLASTLLLKHLEKQYPDKTFEVANISAGSWGFPNAEQYLKKYGTFDADMAIYIANSGDIFDVPTFEPLDPQFHPEHYPILALQEGFTRYLLPKIIKSTKTEYANYGSDFTAQKAEAVRALTAIKVQLDANNIPLTLLLHPTKNELLTGKKENGYAEIVNAAYKLGIYCDDLAEAYEKAADNELYRDAIHLNDKGQEAVFQSLVLHEGQTLGFK